MQSRFPVSIPIRSPIAGQANESFTKVRFRVMRREADGNTLA